MVSIMEDRMARPTACPLMCRNGQLLLSLKPCGFLTLLISWKLLVPLEPLEPLKLLVLWETLETLRTSTANQMVNQMANQRANQKENRRANRRASPLDTESEKMSAEK